MHVNAHPEIINSDQECQFTSNNWVDYLNEWDIKMSMTGKGRESALTMFISNNFGVVLSVNNFVLMSTIQ